MAFTHLHVHSQWSILDGLIKPADAMQIAAADKQTAIAITDHGSLAGTMAWHNAAHQAGIKPILGEEIYLAIGDRQHHNYQLIPAEDDYDGTGGDEVLSKRKNYNHLTLLAATSEGWRNLLAGDNQAHDTYWYRPRWDWNLLADHHTGLIAGTGCLGGPVAGPLLADDYDTALANAALLVDIFGADHVFVEIMDHGIPAERAVIPNLARIARQLRLPLVATNDAHYSLPSQADTHDAWLCLAQSKGDRTVQLSDLNRWRFRGAGYHLRTETEMRTLFDTQPGTEQAVTNTMRVADQIQPDVLAASLPTQWMLPHRPNHQTEFHQRVAAGLTARYGNPLPEPVKQQARYEQQVIFAADNDTYLLIIADIIDDARNGLVPNSAGVPEPIPISPGRGSAASSLCVYALGMTGIDPIEHELVFERFLNPDRPNLPDFDFDIPRSRQYDLIRYVAHKYGPDHVARIGSYGKAKAKDAIKKAARVLGHTYQDGEKLAALIQDPNQPLATLLADNNPAGEQLHETDPRILELATGFDQTCASETVHACGVLISPQPLAGRIPLRRDRKNGNFPVTQWDWRECEQAREVKYDFLSSDTLDIIATCTKTIQQTHGITIDLGQIRPSPTGQANQNTWRLLNQGRTSSVFQLGSAGMKQLLQQVKPRTWDDLSAVVALYRPGPQGGGMDIQYGLRKNGAPITYDLYTTSPQEAAIIARSLDSTCGLIIYQEQLQTLARDIAGFTGGQTGDLQKAFSKKNAALMRSLHGPFIAGGQAPTYPDGRPKVPFQQSTLDRLWETFDASASYLFNKSHSVAYSLVSWQTAWLKANYPAEFGAALLTHATSGKRKDERPALMADLIADGIQILPPDVNQAAASTSVVDGKILFGLAEIRDIGHATAESIIQSRPYKSFADFAARSGCDPQNITALASAGALDQFGPRMGMAAIARTPWLPVPPIEFDPVERCARETLFLKVRLSPSPIQTARPTIRAWLDAHHIGKVWPADTVPASRTRADLVGEVTDTATKQTKTGKPYAILTVAGRTLTCWNNTLGRLPRLPQPGDLVYARVHDDTWRPGGWVADTIALIEPEPTAATHIADA